MDKMFIPGLVITEIKCMQGILAKMMEAHSNLPWVSPVQQWLSENIAPDL